MKVRIGIVEDELLVAEHIMEVLNLLNYEALEPVTNYTDALQLLEEDAPDLMLIDIQLAGMKDGIDLAQSINEKYSIPYIFLTANADTATLERAKKVNPPAYLVKPFNKEDLYAAIEICLNNYKNFNAIATIPNSEEPVLLKEYVFIKVNQYYHKLQIKSIDYIKSDNNYITIYSGDEKYWVRTTMQNFLDLVGEGPFVKVHKSYVVNVQKITLIGGDKIHLGDLEIPMSKVNKAALLDVLNVL